MTELPTYNDASRKGEDGITILKKLVEKKFKWLVRPNHKEHDFGIDVYIDIINDKKQVTGKTIAAQVKTGASYFSETNSLGWVYRDDFSHLNYYLNNDLPVIIILIDDVKKRAYWCHCDVRKTEKTGSKWKITVPFKQKLKKSAKAELLKYISPVTDYVSQMENFWRTNKNMKQAERLVLHIEKEEIIQKSYNDILAALNRMQVNPDLVKELKEKVEIFIDGYNDDSRELFEIPEVNEWAKKIFLGTTGLSYFLNKDDHCQFFNVLRMIYMVDNRVPKQYYRENGKLKFRINLNLKDMTFIKLLYHDLNEFCDKHNLSKEVNIEVTRNINRGVVGEKIYSEIEKRINKG